MGFDDILEDIFDFDDEPKQTAEDVTSEEKNAGLWDTGKKENLWRSSDPVVANGVWDSGSDKADTADPAGSPCGGCPDPCTDPDECGSESLPEEVDSGDPAEVEPEQVPDPDPVTDSDDSGGLFDDLF